MDKWGVLRGFIAKEHNTIKEKYLKEGSTGAKADNANIVITTLETVWKAMDKIDKMEEKEKPNEPTDNNGQSDAGTGTNSNE